HTVLRLLSSFLLPRPPPPPLFPYTTLFRSSPPRRTDRSRGRAARSPRGRSRPPPPRGPRARAADASPGGSRRRRPRPECAFWGRSEEHTSELQSLRHLVCRLLLEKKKKKKQ